MRTVFIIGNGFDINLGLPTRYQDFYDFYLKQPSSSDQISSLKKHLERERYNTWADLELGLGEYTKNLTTEDDVEIILHDLSDYLKAYLLEVSKSFSPLSSFAEQFFRDLAKPYRALPGGMSRVVASYCAKKGLPVNIDVVSFNYTDVFEKLIRVGHANAHLPMRIGENVTLSSIRHIHMSVHDLDIILGVNDEAQVKNDLLKTDRVKMLMVKPYINNQLETLIDEECLALINEADLICLFGVSLGETDAMWWEAIGNHIKTTDAVLLYFAYDKDEIRYNDQLIDKRKHYRSYLNKRLWGENPVDECQDQIYVGYKTALFT